MTEESLESLLASAWDAGFRSGESFANWGTDRTENPYLPPDDAR